MDKMTYKRKVDKAEIPICNIMGVNIAAINMKWLLDYLEKNLSNLKGDYICVSNVHTTVMSYEESSYCAIQNGGIMAIPDGGPLSSLGRKRGFVTMERTTGPSLMYGSAITTAVVKETILVVDTDAEKIDYVPSRANSRVAKAPQSFWLDDILHAHQDALKKGVTDCIDSCTMMQSYGRDLHLVTGSDENIKITTPEDFYTMRALLEAKENAQIYSFESR